MFPLLLIVLGLTVLALGQRLAVMGAAVGALLGAVLLRFFPGAAELWVQLAVVLGLALVGFLAAGFAKGIIDIVILVLGALAGAAIVMAILDLFSIDQGLLNWLLAVVGGVIGLMLIRRSRRSSKDWGIIILASLVGALLIARGLAILLPSLQGSLITTLIVIVLAGGGIAYQGGMIGGRKAAPAPTASTATPAAPKPTATGASSKPPKDNESPPSSMD